MFSPSTWPAWLRDKVRGFACHRSTCDPASRSRSGTQVVRKAYCIGSTSDTRTFRSQFEMRSPMGGSPHALLLCSSRSRPGSRLNIIRRISTSQLSSHVPGAHARRLPLGTKSIPQQSREIRHALHIHLKSGVRLGSEQPAQDPGAPDYGRRGGASAVARAHPHL